MTLIDRHRSCLLFIDMQERLVPELDLGDLVALMCERLMTWLGDQRVGLVVTEYVSTNSATPFLKSRRQKRALTKLHLPHSKSIRSKLLRPSSR